MPSFSTFIVKYQSSIYYEKEAKKPGNSKALSYLIFEIHMDQF